MGSGILEVQLLDARGLSNTDFFSKIDPYVIVKYRNQERKTGVAKEEGRNPVWNETVKFRVDYPVPDNQYKLTLKIMDKDTFSKDDFLGEASIYLSDLMAIGMEKGFYELQSRKHKVVLADKTYCGEIRVAITFAKNKDDGIQEEYGGWSHSAHHY